METVLDREDHRQVSSGEGAIPPAEGAAVGTGGDSGGVPVVRSVSRTWHRDLGNVQVADRNRFAHDRLALTECGRSVTPSKREVWTVTAMRAGDAGFPDWHDGKICTDCCWPNREDYWPIDRCDGRV